MNNYVSRFSKKNTELERSKKINDELKQAIKKELETENMKNEKIYKILKNAQKTD